MSRFLAFDDITYRQDYGVRAACEKLRAASMDAPPPRRPPALETLAQEKGVRLTLHGVSVMPADSTHAGGSPQRATAEQAKAPRRANDDAQPRRPAVACRPRRLPRSGSATRSA